MKRLCKSIIYLFDLAEKSKCIIISDKNIFDAKDDHKIELQFSEIKKQAKENIKNFGLSLRKSILKITINC